MIEITICPVCGGNVTKVCEDWVGNFQGHTYVVPNLEYYVCDECGERIYDRDAMRRIEKYSPAFVRLAEPA